ncbi:MAG: ECF transporter S component [Nitrososphaerota archaeon]|nr:ECF transporter S component [Nitrososphaerota archaeon]MDG6943155.1 ECF transporter S component [Nitrososphaerota archaeon]MDG6950967.1 ECF transporter S component [Nitrososphaerota archaeon]
MPEQAPSTAPGPVSIARKESLFSTKNLVATAIGIALYAALTIPFNVFTIPGVYDVAIRPTVAIPIVFGFIFGPVAGFFSGFIGNILSDQLSFGAFFWNWDLGNGLIGLIPAIGYYAIKKSDWAKTRGLAASAILAIAASVIGIGFSALTDFIFQIGLTTVGAAVAEFIPAAVTDAINGAIIAPILIYTYVRSTAGRARRL